MCTTQKKERIERRMEGRGEGGRRKEGKERRDGWKKEGKKKLP